MTEQKPSPKNNKNDDDQEENGETELRGYKAEGLPEPTRFGDWEVRGRCSDF